MSFVTDELRKWAQDYALIPDNMEDKVIAAANYIDELEAELAALKTQEPNFAPDWADFRHGFDCGVEEAKGLCQDYCSRNGSVYLKDVLAGLDAIPKRASPVLAIPTLPEHCMWAVTKGGHTICQPPRRPKVAIPEGWKLVPIEPTPRMILAMNSAAYGEVYSDMLASAPEYKGEKE